MSHDTDDTPFYIQFLPAPKALRAFFALVSGAFVLGCLALGYAIGASQSDPGDGRLRGDYGRQTVLGVLELTPAPVLHISQGSARIPAGHTLMLSGQGKNGAVPRARSLVGQVVRASGVVLERGDLDMLQLAGGQRGLRAAEDQSSVRDIPVPVPLGRWKLSGEICDGKCSAGAMRPGRGIAHRACANLCITGGIPSVFVTTQPVEGAEFLLIAGEGNDVMPRALYDYVGLYVSLEGDVTRHGDLLVLRVDTDSVELVP